jgi:hypothetical protein
MGVRYRLAGKVVHVTMDDHFDTSEVLQVGAEALSHPEFVQGSNVVIDFRESQEVATGEEIFQRIQFLSEAGDLLGPRIALVVTRPVHFGLARMAELYGESCGLTLRVFNDEQDALDWVDT